MRVTRKILTAIGFGVLIIAMIIRIVALAQLASLLGGIAESVPQARGILTGIVTVIAIFFGTTILLSGFGIGRCIAVDKPTKLIPWAFEVIQIGMMILLVIGMIAGGMVAGGSGTAYTPDAITIAMGVMLFASFVTMIVTLCLSRRRIGFQVSLMVQMAFILAFSIMNIVESTKGGAEVDGGTMANLILMIVSPAFIFIASFIGCFERPVAHGRPKPQVRYDAYGYVIREKKPKPVYEYDEYGYRKPFQQAKPRPTYDEYGYEQRPQPRPQPRPQKQYDEYGYEIKPAQPRPQAQGPRPAPRFADIPIEEERPAPRPAAQPRPAPQPTGVNQNASNELVKLKKMLDAGLITKEEYEAKRKKYLEML